MENEKYLKLDDMFFEADQLIKDQRISDAIIKLNDILAEAPDYGRAHNHLGWIYETKYKDYTKAYEHYRLALKFTPDYAAVYYNYAILLSTMRKFDELEKLLEQAIKVPGINFATIYNEYAIMYETLGKLDDAIHYYKLYAQNLFDTKLIEGAVESVNRCKRKKEIL